MMNILFLDFDGVLHPASPFNRGVGVLCYLERFESVMRDFPDWEFVVSSSWREEFSLDEIRGFFSKDIADRIVGVTPIMFSSGAHSREVEIRQYLQERREQSATWLALDDVPHLFGDHAHVALCAPELGLDEGAASRLREALERTGVALQDRQESVSEKKK